MSALNYSRKPWPCNFPEVVIHALLEARNAHQCYVQAKAGDREAAEQLVADLFNEVALEQLLHQVRGTKGLVAAVSALEDQGFNAIPDVLANEVALRLGWDLDQGDLRQINRVSHTRASGWHRLITQAEFAGDVQPGASYLLVDDHVGFGGTLANFRGYIESQGGMVVSMMTLTETTGGRTIALRQSTLETLWGNHGEELEKLWRESFGYGLDCCTELEAGYLSRQRTLDYIRRQLAKAAKKADQRGLQSAEIL